MTADNPLIDPSIIDLVVEKFFTRKYDYLSNTHPRTFPQGNDVEIFSFSALEKSWSNAKTVFEKEHVTPFIYNNQNLFKIENFSNNVDLSNFRWTVDYPDDFKFVEQIFQKIIRKKINKKWTTKDKETQYIKRGRYTEFNLLYDRGTKFGLQTGGNVEGILMSLPPLAKWK